MLHKILAATAALALATGLSAQCATTTTAANNSGTVTLALNGAPMSFALFALGDTTGTTAINLGNLGTLELGLEAPFIAVPGGLTDMSGDASISFEVPSTAPAGTWYAQGVTIEFSFSPGGPPSFGICSGNVASFSI